MPSTKNTEIKIFCSYSDADRSLQESLEKHLSSLERGGGVYTWHKHKVRAGQERQRIIDDQLDQADIILLLISSNFISSDDCYAGDLVKASRRHDNHRSRVIVILLKPCTWEELEFRNFLVLPRSGVPISLSKNRDAAFKEIVDEIKTTVQDFRLLRSGYMKPLQPNPLHNDQVANKQPTPMRQRTTNTLPRTHTTQRRGRSRTNQRSNILADEATMAVNAKHPKSLPKRYSIQSRGTAQQFLRFFGDNLSGHGFKKRCQRWKGKSAILLSVFVLLDLGLLPYTVYLRSHSAIITGAVSALSLFFFVSGVSNEENAIGVPFALFYFPLWLIMGFWYLNTYLSLGLSQLSVSLLILLATVCRLFLFLWRTPFGQR